MGLSARWTEEKTRKELAAVAAVAVSVDVGESIKVLLVCGTPQAHHIIIHTFTCSVPSLFFLFFYPSLYILSFQRILIVMCAVSFAYRTTVDIFKLHPIYIKILFECLRRTEARFKKMKKKKLSDISRRTNEM